MKFVIDDKIPYIRDVLEPFADVRYIKGSEIEHHHLMDADGLIIRTRTQCNHNLLEGTPVKFIATATIGFDHIDTGYCREEGIKWTNAPGCNSESVNQYIASALTHWAAETNTSLHGLTIGIIGVGNVGSKVARTAELLGMKILLNDPPRAREEGQEDFVELARILKEADIISLHVPLNMGGRDKTFHMTDNEFIANWKSPALLINSCRGEVVETASLKLSLDSGKLRNCIIDCWENEPHIDRCLLDKCLIGTPHIAGYSRDGKANGTSQCVNAVSRFFQLGLEEWYPEKIENPRFPVIMLNGEGMNEEQILGTAIESTYKAAHDSIALKSNPGGFENLRGDYPVRREFHAFTIKSKNISTAVTHKLKQLGFVIEN